MIVMSKRTSQRKADEKQQWQIEFSPAIASKSYLRPILLYHIIALSILADLVEQYIDNIHTYLYTCTDTHVYIIYIYIAWYSMHVHATSHISGDVSSRNLLVIPPWSLRRQAALTTLVHGIIEALHTFAHVLARYGPNDPWQLDMGHIVLSCIITWWSNRNGL